MLTTRADIARATEPRGMHSSKYGNGAVLVIGGGSTYTGAPALALHAANAALSALRTGTGYASILVERGIEPIEKALNPNLVVRSFKDSSRTAELLGRVSSIRHNAVVIGPGMDERGLLYRSIKGLVESELSKGNIVVMDAGAILAAKGIRGSLTRNAILTPHMGEFRTMGLKFNGDDVMARMAAAVEVAREYNCTLVLKGHETVITNGLSTRVNVASSPALATMGTGDVLSGMIAAYAAMHGNPFESAVAGVTAHSMMGDLLHKRMGNHVIATDLIDLMPSFLRKFDK